MKIILIVLIVLLILVATIVSRNFKGVHTTEIIINKPFEDVWNWISNPLNYETIYPHWIKTASKVDDVTFDVNDQFGKSYKIHLKAIKDSGVVDLEIAPWTSRTRIVPLDGNSTIVVHIAKRAESEGFIQWFFHKLTTDRDFKNAKKVIEK